MLAALSLGLTVPVWIHARSTNRLARRFGLRFPMQSYVAMLSRLRFRDLWNVVYDQLTPRIAHFPSGADIRDWVQEAHGRIMSQQMRTQNSWCVSISDQSRAACA